MNTLREIMKLKAKGSDGQYYKDNLKADTRTAIYENVFYTMNKYNAWITGRSPAFGDEDHCGLTEEKMKPPN